MKNLLHFSAKRPSRFLFVSHPPVAKDRIIGQEVINPAVDLKKKWGEEKKKAKIWSSTQQKLLTLGIKKESREKNKDIREVQRGDTLVAIIRGLSGKEKLGKELKVIYRSKKLTKKTIEGWNKMNPKYQISEDLAGGTSAERKLSEINLILPGQYIWINESGKVIIDDKAPKGAVAPSKKKAKQEAEKKHLEEKGGKEKLEKQKAKEEAKKKAKEKARLEAEAKKERNKKLLSMAKNRMEDFSTPIDWDQKKLFRVVGNQVHISTKGKAKTTAIFGEGYIKKRLGFENPKDAVKALNKNKDSIKKVADKVKAKREAEAKAAEEARKKAVVKLKAEVKGKAAREAQIDNLRAEIEKLKKEAERETIIAPKEKKKEVAKKVGEGTVLAPNKVDLFIREKIITPQSITPADTSAAAETKGEDLNVAGETGQEKTKETGQPKKETQDKKGEEVKKEEPKKTKEELEAEERINITQAFERFFKNPNYEQMVDLISLFAQDKNGKNTGEIIFMNEPQNPYTPGRALGEIVNSKVYNYKLVEGGIDLAKGKVKTLKIEKKPKELS